MLPYRLESRTCSEASYFNLISIVCVYHALLFELLRLRQLVTSHLSIAVIFRCSFASRCNAQVLKNVVSEAALPAAASEDLEPDKLAIRDHEECNACWRSCVFSHAECVCQCSASHILLRPFSCCTRRSRRRRMKQGRKKGAQAKRKRT